MIRLPSTILVALAPVDLHFSFDRLVGIVRHELGADPKADTVVVFHNRRRTHVKLLWHDGSGYVVLTSDSTAPHFASHSQFRLARSRYG